MLTYLPFRARVGVGLKFPNDLRRRVYIDAMNTGVTFGAYTSYAFEPYLQNVRSLITDSPNPLTEWLIKTDLSVQQLAKRATWLMEMWQHDMSKWNEDAMCVLSEKDRYVNADGVKQWIEEKGTGASVLVAPGWRHGSCVLDNDGHGVWEQIFEHLHCLSEAQEKERNIRFAEKVDDDTAAPTHAKKRRVSRARRQSGTMGGLTKRVVSFVDGLNTM